jgi:SAM-dependent methyltransferase
MNCFCDGKFESLPCQPKAWRGLQMNFFRCAQCRHVTVFPVPNEGQLNSYYETEYEYPGRGHLDNSILLDMEALICAGGAKSVHDYGCGDGYHIGKLKFRFPNLVVTGYEPSGRCVEKARADGLWGVWSQPAIHANADIVMLNHSLEHSPNPITTLMHARESMSPSGIMIIRVPNAAYGYTLQNFTDWKWCGVPWHLNYFTPMSIKSALYNVGLVERNIYCSAYREQATAIQAENLRRCLSAEELVVVAKREAQPENPLTEK